MTIRYQCEECESVLKIQDKLAGTAAKCPKCKTAFKIPSPTPSADNASKKSPASAKEKSGPVANSAVDTEDPVDMPREITPLPDMSSMDEFDPMDALTGSAPVATAVAAVPEAPKPSIADLMREHEAKKKKKKGHEKGKKGGLAEAAVAAEVYTSGSAADALTRTYDQKRGKAGDAPALTREEQREADQKEAMKEFAKKGGIALGGMAVVLYFFFSWWLSESLPDLEYVAGVVTLNGAPLADVDVMFAPLGSPDDPDVIQGGPSTALTNANGEYVMMYNPTAEGVIPGRHQITITGSSGAAYNLPTQHQQKTVPADDEAAYNFDL